MISIRLFSIFLKIQRSYTRDRDKATHCPVREHDTLKYLKLYSLGYTRGSNCHTYYKSMMMVRLIISQISYLPGSDYTIDFLLARFCLPFFFHLFFPPFLTLLPLSLLPLSFLLSFLHLYKTQLGVFRFIATPKEKYKLINNYNNKPRIWIIQLYASLVGVQSREKQILLEWKVRRIPEALSQFNHLSSKE